MEKQIAYFDSGTSNTRLYLLNLSGVVLHHSNVPVGSKDSAIAGSNQVLLSAMRKLYDAALAACRLTDSNICALYASGMITSKFGMKEVPHLLVPVGQKELQNGICHYYEDTYFHREFCLIRGVKTESADISYVNMMRGEEIEIIGALDFLPETCKEKSALILPGSHTHIALVENGKIVDLISNFTGELFHAIQSSTILAPVLNAPVAVYDPYYLKKGAENLQKFGVTRALYIAQIMQTFDYADAVCRKSYIEGVISGGVIQALAYYRRERWENCTAIAVLSSQQVFTIFKSLLSADQTIHCVEWLPIRENRPYSVEGIKKLAHL